MRLRSSVERLLLTAVAMLQMAMPAVASIADGWLRSGDAVQAVGHAEDQTQANCVAVHTDECVLCRIIAHCATYADPAFRSHALRPASLHVGAGRPCMVGRAVVANSRPRAPPLV